MDKIRFFTDLNAWKEGYKLVLTTYKDLFHKITNQSIEVHKIIKGLIKSSKNILNS